MATQTGSYDFNAAKKAYDEGSTKATSFIFKTTGKDAWVCDENHGPQMSGANAGEPYGPSSMTPTTGWRIGEVFEMVRIGVSWLRAWVENGVAKMRVGRADASHITLDSNGMDVSDGTDSVAAFGATARIGKDAGPKIEIANSSLTAYNNQGSQYFTVTADAMSFGAGTVATTGDVAAAKAEAIDGVIVGGTNRIFGSEGLQVSGLGSEPGSHKEWLGLYTGQSYMDIPGGTMVTLSFDLYMTVNTANPTLHIYNTNYPGPKQFRPGTLYFEAAAGSVIDKRVSLTSVLDDTSSTQAYNYLEFYSTYGTSNWYSISNIKMEVGNKATSWSPAPEDVASETQRIYYRSKEAGTVTSPGTTWVTKSTDQYNANTSAGLNGWSTKITPMASGVGASQKYPYLYTAEQRRSGAGDVTTGHILLDETTTIIDGGSIVTGSVAANAISASSGYFDVANIPDLSAAKITSGTIDAARIGAGSISVGKLDSSTQNTISATAAQLDQFGYRYKKEIIIYGDSSRYYPVYFAAGDQNISRLTLVSRSYNDQHPADWNSATHGGGLTLLVEWNFGGWGGAAYTQTIHALNETYNSTVGKVQAGLSDGICGAIWLRGGGSTGALYRIFSDQLIETTHYNGTFPHIGTDTGATFMWIGGTAANPEYHWEVANYLTAPDTFSLTSMMPEKNANAFITAIDSSGITIHTLAGGSNPSANYLNLNAYGVYAYKDSTHFSQVASDGFHVYSGDALSDVAHLGSDLRIGKAAGPRVEIINNGSSGTSIKMYGKSDGSEELAHIGFESGNAQSGTAMEPYYTFGRRMQNSAIGNWSMAEGTAVIASEFASHAEGFGTTASGQSSHAEGSQTIASGQDGHAEGNSTTASGLTSHSEGYGTTASGTYSHAEGSGTTAGGYYSHAQNYKTIAGSNYQTAIGRYNDNKTLTAFEIGNGTAENDRRNAFEVDWQGNVVAAGTLTLGDDTVWQALAGTNSTIYYKRHHGVVYVVGNSGAGGVSVDADGTLVGALPGGYWPPMLIVGAAAMKANKVGQFNIDTNGNITVWDFAGASVYWGFTVSYPV